MKIKILLSCRTLILTWIVFSIYEPVSTHAIDRSQRSTYLITGAYRVLALALLTFLTCSEKSSLTCTLKASLSRVSGPDIFGFLGNFLPLINFFVWYPLLNPLVSFKAFEGQISTVEIEKIVKLSFVYIWTLQKRKTLRKCPILSNLVSFFLVPFFSSPYTVTSYRLLYRGVGNTRTTLRAPIVRIFWTPCTWKQACGLSNKIE